MFAMSDLKPDDATTDTPAAAAAPKSRMVPLLVGVNTLMMAGMLAVVLLKGAAPAAAPAKHADESAEASEKSAEGEGGEHEGKKPAVGPTVKLDDFVVRLRNPDTDRFARVSFEIEVASDKDKERLLASMARVRDGFIGELTDRTVEELRGTEGLTTIKGTLTTKLKDLVPTVHVRGLYVTDFIVQ